MAGVVHLDLVTHTLLGERWARGATPPPTPTAPGQPSRLGPARTPFGGPLFYLCHYFFFPVSCSSLPYSQDKTELRQDRILLPFFIWSGLRAAWRPHTREFVPAASGFAAA